MNAKTDRRYESTMEIAAPREAVWEALATRPGLERWFPAEAVVNPGAGGEVQWKWGDAHVWKQRIEVWEPGRRLKTAYDSGVDDGKGGKVPLFVDFLLEGEGGKTTLRLVHSGFGPDAAFDQEYDGISTGWPGELRSLKLSLERHRGAARQLAWRTALSTLPADEAWRRLTGSGGLDCGSRLDALKEGEPFRMRLPSGEVIEGTAIVTHSRQFTGLVTSHGHGWIRIAVECCVRRESGALDVWVWLATYGRPAADVERSRAGIEAMLDGLFAASTPAAPARTPA